MIKWMLNESDCLLPPLTVWQVRLYTTLLYFEPIVYISWHSVGRNVCTCLFRAVVILRFGVLHVDERMGSCNAGSDGIFVLPS